MLPGLIGTSVKREIALATALAVVGAYAGATAWTSRSQLAECKAEKRNGWVAVLNGQGERLDVTVVGADDWRLADGMVKRELGDVVRCMRALDPVADVTIKCWEEKSQLFFGDAKKSIEAYGKELFPNADSVARRLRMESISVELQSWQKPDVHAPSRFLLTWTETHKATNGLKPVRETWSGLFDVDLVPIDPKLNNSPLRIVRYEWRCNAGCGGAKGGA